ncbi:uncharacterized protein NFIA_101960 [Aspergillus fischeri NRRL 181]|uniref:MACPF-like domain-containing protein n=1 Tax=Neosartorya fischeri (strain ATCC 1020 / DSM 3700 / CBS 544.65 / FGSC A1164 / JCM 1740 / NRRL 181 / WB 181) TaxID=331117 RepID=A1CVR0_NEOFI|nr:conserved hypothetical protein [Aspergillus fischeri NRRL 181]EAW24712.1 conserved hypothetical protein [Aspergillus fischeri NRRL 181]
MPAAKNESKGATSQPPKDAKTDPKQQENLKEIEGQIKESEEANKTDRQAMFNIYLFDSVTKTSQMEKFVTIGSIKNVEDTTLADIRKGLISENALSWRQKSSKFCNDEGAEVDDKLRFDMYLDFLNSSEEKPKDEEGSTDDSGGKRAKGNNGRPITRESSAGKSYKVYLKLRKIPTELDEATKDFLKEKLDLSLNKPGLTSAEVNKLTSSYNHSNFQALAGKNPTHPADMGEREWYIVLQNNSILHGNYVRELANGQRKVERAMYPAFALKPRKFHDFEIVFNSGGKNGATPSASDNEPVVHHLRIPRFLVQDDSYINVSENKTSVADAIADSSLSEHSAEVSVGGGAFGVTAGVKVGYKSQAEVKTASNTTSDSKRMTITYNFPRVVLELDGDSLDISDECKKDLENISTPEAVQFFRRKYGTFFASRVELGGRLHSSESSDSFAEGKVEERARALKISAAASFSSTYVQGSASGSYEDSSNHSSNRQNSSLSTNLAWEAKGGDTLLCNNPPAWCATVASYYNWRISKQDDLLSMEDMISLIPGYEYVKQKFNNLAPLKESEVTKKPDPLPQEWDGWVTFWLKHPNELLYPTVCDNSSSNPFGLDSAIMTPAMAELLANAASNFASSHSVQMKASAEDDSQIYQAGTKFYEVYDGKTVRYRFKPGFQYVVWNKKTNMYLGAKPPVPGVTQKSELCTTNWANSCTFKFTHAFPTDKIYISNRDLVRVEIFDSQGKPIGPLKDMPPLGSYGTSGDIFQFRYLGEP